MKRILQIILFSFFTILVVSCHKDEPPKPDADRSDIRQVTLVYAVNRSSLSRYLPINEEQILKAMKICNESYESSEDEYVTLVYKTDSDGTPALYETYRDETGAYAYRLVRNFDTSRTSCDPIRISEVLNFVIDEYPESERNLFLWGHGMSWTPYFKDHDPQKPSVIPDEELENMVTANRPDLEAFGGEKINGETDWIDIKELADAIPDNVFKLIWFDSCYMSNIELIYEFRNKCKFYIGYATEIYGYGLPYNLALAEIMKEEPDYVAAAKKLHDYYADKNQAVTVAVIDMSKLENVADRTRDILSNGAVLPEKAGLLNYSRTRSCPYYDFRQFVSVSATANKLDERIESFIKAVNGMTLYADMYELDFNGVPIDRNKFSGINTHFYEGSDLRTERYYRTLDWYNRVYLSE